MIKTDSVIVRIIDLPTPIKGVTVKDENGDYNIYLNGRLSGEAQAIAFRHEVEHIKQGHFYSELPVKMKEQQVG